MRVSAACLLLTIIAAVGALVQQSKSLVKILLPRTSESSSSPSSSRILSSLTGSSVVSGPLSSEKEYLSSEILSSLGIVSRVSYSEDRIPYNIAIQKLLSTNKRNFAASLLRSVIENGHELSADTIHILIKDAFNRRDPVTAEQLFNRYFSSGSVRPTPRSLNMMMDGFRSSSSSVSSIIDSERVFYYNSLFEKYSLQRDSYSYSTLIRLAQKATNALNLLFEAQQQGALSEPLIRCAIESLGKLGDPTSAVLVATRIPALSPYRGVFADSDTVDSLLLALLQMPTETLKLQDKLLTLSQSIPPQLELAASLAAGEAENLQVQLIQQLENLAEGSICATFAFSIILSDFKNKDSSPSSPILATTTAAMGKKRVLCGSKGWCVMFTYIQRRMRELREIVSLGLSSSSSLFTPPTVRGGGGGKSSSSSSSSDAAATATTIAERTSAAKSELKQLRKVRDLLFERLFLDLVTASSTATTTTTTAVVSATAMATALIDSKADSSAGVVKVSEQEEEEVDGSGDYDNRWSASTAGATEDEQAQQSTSAAVVNTGHFQHSQTVEEVVSSSTATTATPPHQSSSERRPSQEGGGGGEGGESRKRLKLNGRICDAVLRCYVDDVTKAKDIWKDMLLPLARRIERLEAEEKEEEEEKKSQRQSSSGTMASISSGTLARNEKEVSSSQSPAARDASDEKKVNDNSRSNNGGFSKPRSGSSTSSNSFDEIAQKGLEALMYVSGHARRADLGFEIALTARKRSWPMESRRRLGRAYVQGKVQATQQQQQQASSLSLGGSGKQKTTTGAAGGAMIVSTAPPSPPAAVTTSGGGNVLTDLLTNGLERSIESELGVLLESFLSVGGSGSGNEKAAGNSGSSKTKGSSSWPVQRIRIQFSDPSSSSATTATTATAATTSAPASTSSGTATTATTSATSAPASFSSGTATTAAANKERGEKREAMRRTQK